MIIGPAGFGHTRKTRSRSYFDIPFKVKFRLSDSSGKLIADVPRWVRDIHFDLMLVTRAFPIGSFHPEIGKEYKVRIARIGVKRTVVWVEED